MPVGQPVKQATQVAIVTDGSRGIGRHTVMCLARRGVHSIFTYQTAEAQAQEVVALTAEAGAKAIALQLDVANSTSFADFARRVQASLAELGVDCFDYLVNIVRRNRRRAVHRRSHQRTLPQQMFDGLRDTIDPSIVAVPMLLLVVGLAGLLTTTWLSLRSSRTLNQPAV